MTPTREPSKLLADLQIVREDLQRLAETMQAVEAERDYLLDYYYAANVLIHHVSHDVPLEPCSTDCGCCRCIALANFKQAEQSIADHFERG